VVKTTVNEVADFFLGFACEHGDPLTNLKLQKLTYYAQAWHLALHGSRLFDGEFQAWVHGPVMPCLYQRFKANAWAPIVSVQAPVDIAEAVESHLVEVMKAYSRFSAYDLERLTHSERPWKNARRGLACDESSQNEISDDDMKSYYKGLLQ